MYCKILHHVTSLSYLFQCLYSIHCRVGILLLQYIDIDFKRWIELVVGSLFWILQCSQSPVPAVWRGEGEGGDERGEGIYLGVGTRREKEQDGRGASINRLTKGDWYIFIPRHTVYCLVTRHQARLHWRVDELTWTMTLVPRSEENNSKG